MDGEAVFRQALPDLLTSPVPIMTAYGSIGIAHPLGAGTTDQATLPVVVSAGRLHLNGARPRISVQTRFRLWTQAFPDALVSGISYHS